MTGVQLRNVRKVQRKILRMLNNTRPRLSVNPRDLAKDNFPDMVVIWLPWQLSKCIYRFCNIDMDIFDIEVTLIGLVLCISIAYFILVIVIFFICIRFQPDRFVQSYQIRKFEDGESQAIASPSYMDCSGITKYCPCPVFSFRQFLKSCCCDSEKLRHSVNCECIRPAVHGSQSSGLNCVCCQVNGSN